MNRLRQSFLWRACALGLLLGLGAGLAPPVAAADGSAFRDRLATGAISPEALDALLAAGPAMSLGDFEAALVARLGDEATARALVAALFGQLLRIYRYDRGQGAVLVVAGPSAAGPAPSVVGLAARSVRPTLAEWDAAGAPAEAGDDRPTPRALRPALQPLGP